MKAIQPISDKTIEIDPNRATTWFILYKKAIESILRLGEGTTSLGMQCSAEQCSAVTYQIMERLPHTLLTQAYQFEGNPREGLKKKADIINKARTNAEKRATELPVALHDTSRAQ